MSRSALCRGGAEEGEQAVAERGGGRGGVFFSLPSRESSWGVLRSTVSTLSFRVVLCCRKGFCDVRVEKVFLGSHHVYGVQVLREGVRSVEAGSVKR